MRDFLSNVDRLYSKSFSEVFVGAFAFRLASQRLGKFTPKLRVGSTGTIPYAQLLQDMGSCMGEAATGDDAFAEIMGLFQEAKAVYDAAGVMSNVRDAFIHGVLPPP